MKKYELVHSDTITIAPGRTATRIRALVAIAALGITPGELGGYVETESNLAQVGGDAWVYGNAWVSGDARVSGSASILVIGPIGSRQAMLTAHADAKTGVRFSTGCFSGSRAEFEAAITARHGNNEHGKAYAAALMLADVVIKPAGVTQ